MDEKTMVNDVLKNIKSELITYQNMISETENMGLRQTMQRIRNNGESFQYELLKVAQAKGYHKASAKATVTEVTALRTELEE